MKGTIDIDTPYFDPPRGFAKRLRKDQKKGWEEIRNYCAKPFRNLNEWLKYKVGEENWPRELVEDSSIWGSIIHRLEATEQKALEQQEIHLKGKDSATLGAHENPDFKIPTDEYSCWQKYRETLRKKGLTEPTVDSIEEECFKTLKYLRLGDGESGKDPVKGLVVGHVQSGKTANMAGLMAMCADWKFNMFIVLTGSIENLRLQNQRRLIEDLNVEDANLQWRPVARPRKNASIGDRAADMNFGQHSPLRYLTVCLKNGSRLKQLIGWLREHSEKLSQMQIVIIDDEADQAGINTASTSEDERKPINKLLLELVSLPARSMNYIAYTATPYANILNEAGKDTLYPNSFIRALPLNNSYFGPERLFGMEDSDQETLDMIRYVSDEEISTIKDIHDDAGNESPPDSLVDALAWFVCSAAARRVIGISDPTSMLIHTSQRVLHHQNMADAVEETLRNKCFRNHCRMIWETETEKLKLTDFEEQFPLYEGEVHDYPPFDQIEIHFDDLLAEIGHIKFNADNGTEPEPSYTKGIHLCIDNYRNKGLNDEGEHVRLLYPENGNKPDHSTAFIVIGGATLSRGLTIEGLTSTFFLRTSSLGDSLMQMGRWFGYRRGYELLPRIWTTQTAFERFRYMATGEALLREELKIYETEGATPTQFGPKIISWAPARFLRITSKNKMQNAKPADFDFSGVRSETTLFSEKKKWLDHNISVTEDFIEKIGSNPLPVHNKALFFAGIDFDTIEGYLRKMNFHKKNKFFSGISMFLEWFQQIRNEFDDWNVVVSGLSGIQQIGNGLESKSIWEVRNYAVRKVVRTKRNNMTDPASFSIGSLSDPMDRIIDIPNHNEKKALNEADALKLRKKANLENTPQLIIYRIDGQGTLGNLPKKRSHLNLESDVIGLLLRVPGQPNKAHSLSVTVNIPEGAYPEDDADIEDANEE